MAAFDIANFPDQSVLRLVGTLDDSTASPTVTVTWDAGSVGPYKQVDNTPGNDTIITEMFVTISPNLAETGGSEGFWLTGGAEVLGKTRQASYTATYRGLLNSEIANPPTAGYSRNYSAHKNNALIVVSEVVPVKDLNATFTAGTTTNTAEAGEDIEALDSVSLHTDGKLYEYHATNYPNLVGVCESAYATGVTATYTTFGGVSTGHSSLTIGATQYAENTGTITESSSGTTTILGTAETATTIRIAKVVDTANELTQAQAEDATDTVFGTVTGQRLGQSFDEHIVNRFPELFFSTVFESKDRFDISEIDGGTVTINTLGMAIASSTTFGSHARASLKINNPTDISDMSSVTVSIVADCGSATDDTERSFVGCSDVTFSLSTTFKVDTSGSYMGFAFENESGTSNLYAVCSNGTSNTNTLLQTFSSGQSYELKMIKDATSIEYYVDGTLAATHTTNLPTAMQYEFVGASNTSGSLSAHDLQVYKYSIIGKE